MSLHVELGLELLLQEPVPAFLLSLGEGAQHVLGGHLLRQAFNSHQPSLCEEAKDESLSSLLCFSDREEKYLGFYIKKVKLTFQD